MEEVNREYDDRWDLEPETVAVGLIDLTAGITDDDEALEVMLQVVAIAMDWRSEMASGWN